jgi:hypothetical protein
METNEILKHVEKLKEALEKHRAYLDSIDDDVCDILNDSGYYVSGAIETLDEEIFLLENSLGSLDDEDDEEEED